MERSYRLGSYPRIEFTVSSERLARDVHHALTRFGVVAKLWQKKERCWRVEITSPDSVSLYQAEIGWTGEKSLRFVDEAFTRRELPRRGSNYGHPSREVWAQVRRAPQQRSLSLMELARRSGETAKTGRYAGYNPHTGRSLPAYRLRNYAEVLEDQRLSQVASPDLLWDEIVSIEPESVTIRYTILPCQMVRTSSPTTSASTTQPWLSTPSGTLLARRSYQLRSSRWR